MLQNPELHYLDNAATTIVAPEVADVIDKAMREHWANPSSLYGPVRRSEEALNAARAAVARTLGCKSKELYFTSCGSESNNLALLGAVQTRTFGKGIVVSGFEHPSVQRPLERLAAEGYDVTVVKPRADGTLDIDEMLDHVDKNTILVACMMVNNEVGTRNEVGAPCCRGEAPQQPHPRPCGRGAGMDARAHQLDNIDTLSVSGHKIHAPKGIGALYLSDRLVQAFQPPYLGGEQERGLRPGTENLPYAMGLAAAATRLAKDHEEPGHRHACAEPAAAGGAESLPGGGHQQPGERRARGAELQRDVHQERDDAGFSGGRADLRLLGQRLRPRSAQPHAGSHGARPAGHRYGHPGVSSAATTPRRTWTPSSTVLRTA